MAKDAAGATGGRRRDQGGPADGDLARRIRDGDQEAWAALLERYSDVLYRKALEYSGHGSGVEDEAGELYLFLVELVRRSLGSFKGRCQLRTWILSVIGNRRQVLKAFLLRKDPGRADVRLPRALQGRPPMEAEIFRRLVWGLERTHIAQELDVPEAACAAVEERVARLSPRVYARIRANRAAQARRVSLDEWPDEGGTHPRLQVAGAAPDPLEQLERDDQAGLLRQGLNGALGAMSTAERRVLALMYNHGFTAAEVAAAAREGDLGLPHVDDANQCYYLKDRALERIVAGIRAQLDAAGYEAGPAPDRRELMQRVADLLRETGVPEEER
ncbi:MAG: hypothetical protein ABIL09_13080 [Gemmatimonadota bacterium]